MDIKTLDLSILFYFYGEVHVWVLIVEVVQKYCLIISRLETKKCVIHFRYQNISYMGGVCSAKFSYSVVYISAMTGNSGDSLANHVLADKSNLSR